MKHWVKDAEDFLYSRYLDVCTTFGVDPLTKLPFSPPLDESEAQSFMLGIQNNLYTVDEEGYVQSSLLPAPSGNNNKQKMLQLFWARENKRNLFREGVCQLASASSLIHECGWRPHHIIMEPGFAEFGNLAYGVDIAIKMDSGHIAVCGEVKKDKPEFDKLVSGFKHCCERGPHTKNECLFSRNHAKYEFCATIKPRYFFASAPCETICFTMSYADGKPYIEKETHNLPHSTWF